MKYSHRWSQFIKERFDPWSYSTMIMTFLGAHYAVYVPFQKQKTVPFLGNPWYLVPLIAAVFLFFFMLRLFDEVKDIDSDAIYHPERPLPRGVLEKNDILGAIFVIIVLEVLLISPYGTWALASTISTIGYSLLMYKEFFLKKWLRLHLTTYAVTHTFIVIFISLTIFFCLFRQSFMKIPLDVFFFSFGGWFLFNIFEFGRKSFAQQEERKGVNSYSKIFGRHGAVLLVLIMAIVSIVCIDHATNRTITRLLVFWLGLTSIIGFLYAALNRPYLAKIYRLVTSLYIIFTYGTVIIFKFL